MRDGELTTYSPVRMRWVFDSPIEFRRGLLQGLAESDGSVSISGQQVELWIGPSWDFGRGLLRTFGIHAFGNREALTISKGQASEAFNVPIFSPILRTVRYQALEKLAGANRVPRGTRLPIGVRERIRRLAIRGLSVPMISNRIVDEFGTSVGFESIQRWANRSLARIVGEAESEQKNRERSR